MFLGNNYIVDFLITDFCILENESQYERIRPIRKRFFKGERVRVKCGSSQTMRLKCMQNPADKNEYFWSPAEPQCN